MAKKSWVQEEVLESDKQLDDDWVPVGGEIIGAGVYSGGVIKAKGFDQLSCLFDYTQGDETQLDVKVQFSDTEAFTTAYERIVTDTSAAGLSTILENTFKRTADSRFELPISLRGWFVRIMVKRTGGTPDDAGTVSVKYRLENIERN